MSRQKHSPTPWVIDQSGEIAVFLDANRNYVGPTNGFTIADESRVLACVNACPELPDPSGLPAALDELCRLASLDEVSPRAIARVLDELGVWS